MNLKENAIRLSELRLNMLLINYLNITLTINLSNMNQIDFKDF